MGQVPPLTARPQHVEDRLAEVEPRLPAWPAECSRPWRQRLVHWSFVVGAICRIWSALHLVNCQTLSLRYPPPDSFAALLFTVRSSFPSPFALIRFIFRIRFSRFGFSILEVLIFGYVFYFLLFYSYLFIFFFFFTIRLQAL
jgi:hypothetical protein